MAGNAIAKWISIIGANRSQNPVVGRSGTRLHGKPPDLSRLHRDRVDNNGNFESPPPSLSPSPLPFLSPTPCRFLYLPFSFSIQKFLFLFIFFLSLSVSVFLTHSFTLSSLFLSHSHLFIHSLTHSPSLCQVSPS